MMRAATRRGRPASSESGHNVSMPLTRKAINGELAKRGHTARLENAGQSFYFQGGECHRLA